MNNPLDTILDFNGVTFIGIDTETIPKLKGGRKNPMQGQVTKQTTGANCMIFQNKNQNGYENAVKKRLAKEGKDPESFELQPRRWGKRISGTPFVVHNGRYYLEVIFLNAGTTSYFFNGKSINKNDVIGLNSSQDAEQGGLDDKVIIRTYAISSIVAININGQRIELKPR